MNPLLIYISGPYSADTEEGRLINTNKAIDAGIEVMKKGHYAVVPHLSHFLDLRAREQGVDLPWELWMEQDLAILEKCDCLYFIGSSKGADIEKERALDWGLEVYYSLDEVPDCGVSK